MNRLNRHSNQVFYIYIAELVSTEKEQFDRLAFGSVHELAKKEFNQSFATTDLTPVQYKHLFTRGKPEGAGYRGGWEGTRGRAFLWYLQFRVRALCMIRARVGEF